MEYQNTVGGEVFVPGLTLHSGTRASVRILPAPENSGIVFRRVDLPGKPEIRAFAGNVTNVMLATTITNLQNPVASVSTVEHVMSSLHAAEIDNAVVEINGLEPPICDGSAAPFFDGIMKAGIVKQNTPARFWQASAKIDMTIPGHDIRMSIEPADHLEIEYTVDYSGNGTGAQTFSCIVTPELFERELKRARTFCVYGELRQLVAAGLARGGSLDCAVILMPDGSAISQNGFRYPDELVRHKVMDLIGDLYLAGMRVKGKVKAYKAGHPAHVQLCRMMLEQSAQRKG